MIALAEWRKAAQYFDFAGHRIAFWAPPAPDLQKPVLLLIHGYPTSSWDWSAMWPALEQDFNLVALDMLGFGMSDKPSGVDYSILDQADLQEALLERLGLGEAHVLAHDYGDTVAQELLARHNDRTLSFSLKSLVFLNGGLFPEQHRARPIQKLGLSPIGSLMGVLLTRKKLRANFDAIFGPHTKADDAEIDGYWELICENGGRRVLHKLLHYIPERRMMRARWVGAMKEAHIPLRLIDGGMDPVSGRHLYDYYLEQTPNADAVLLEDIGHYPHTEAPQQVLAAFRKFHHALGTFSS